MIYSEVLSAAKTRIGPYCKVCPVCDGRTCRNTMPGPGAKGTGTAAMRNYAAWQNIFLNMDTICENGPVDTGCTLFGQHYALPLFAGPVGAVKLHYGDLLDDTQYNDILVSACAQAGTSSETSASDAGRSRAFWSMTAASAWVMAFRTDSSVEAKYSVATLRFFR